MIYISIKQDQSNYDLDLNKYNEKFNKVFIIISS